MREAEATPEFTFQMPDIKAENDEVAVGDQFEALVCGGFEPFQAVRVFDNGTVVGVRTH